MAGHRLLPEMPGNQLITESGLSRLGSPVINVRSSDIPARMLIRGFKKRRSVFEFYWKTEVKRNDVQESIYKAGRAIKASEYGCGYARTMTWITKPDATPSDVEDAKFHRYLLNGVLVKNFKQLSAASEDFEHLVEWIAAYDDSDFSTDQFRVTSSGRIALTDACIVGLIEDTAQPGLRENAEAVAASFQHVYETELVLAALSGLGDIDSE